MIPCSLISLSSLNGVAKTYEEGPLWALWSDPDIRLLWGALQDAGCSTLPQEYDVEPGSSLHRWIVFDAILSADPPVKLIQSQKEALNAAKAWVADPCESTQKAIHEAIPVAQRFGCDRVVHALRAAESLKTQFILSSASRAHAVHGQPPGGPSAIYDTARDAARDALRRYRVLAAMAQAGILPDPEVGNWKDNFPRDTTGTGITIAQGPTRPLAIVGTRIKNAYEGMSWLVLRRNIAWSSAGFTGLQFAGDCIQVLNGRGLSPAGLFLSPFLNFAGFWLFFFCVGVPYYFLRNIIISPTAISPDSLGGSSEFRVKGEG